MPGPRERGTGAGRERDREREPLAHAPNRLEDDEGRGEGLEEGVTAGAPAPPKKARRRTAPANPAAGKAEMTVAARTPTDLITPPNFALPGFGAGGGGVSGPRKAHLEIGLDLDPRAMLGGHGLAMGGAGAGDGFGLGEFGGAFLCLGRVWSFARRRLDLTLGVVCFFCAGRNRLFFSPPNL